MIEPNAVSRPLDELAADLDQVVARAAAANEDAAIAAAFDKMSEVLEAAIPRISQAGTVLQDHRNLELEPVEREEINARRETLARRLTAVREQFARDPVAMRNASVWRDMKLAVDALQSSLVAGRDAAYGRLLRGFEQEDRQQLATLPPDTLGVSEYRAAIERFSQLRESSPASPGEVARAVAAGERMRELRAQTEENAVPFEHRVVWRLLLGPGLPLTDLTEDFRAWLTSRDLEGKVLMRLDIS